MHHGLRWIGFELKISLIQSESQDEKASSPLQFKLLLKKLLYKKHDPFQI